jgi:protein-L-isoaspartate(D-aspartate) O-methyltransferase
MTMHHDKDLPKSEQERMVRLQILARGVEDPRVLDVMLKVPRDKFMPENVRPYAWEDRPVKIGWGQTISQPYIVAFMTEKLGLTGNEKVLEIGTGTGYQTAILAELSGEVFSVEIIPELESVGKANLSDAGYTNVYTICGNGYLGWPEEAPFDRIIVTAAPEKIPGRLLEQLGKGGRMVVPVGSLFQDLIIVDKDEDGCITRRSVLGVRFVPMTGKPDEEHPNRGEPDS